MLVLPSVCRSPRTLTSTKAHKVYSGEEALGLLESRAGLTADSLVQLKEALKMVMNEDPRSESEGHWVEVCR